ncbi:hypothetical protein Pan241w_54530 [Gimesia alba]|uniref:Uncharacterized protein n=1 Tax=Gimesia alba TaxID=2527973 RepID=A0A517RN73_9PLAN|nr:hypothetical protein Pan241w_54530 [Gimesia alba]
MKSFLLPYHAVIPEGDLLQHIALIVFETVELREE